MALTPGLQVGPYRILSALGAGGMGEVYRARDTRLGRDVAVKVISQAFSGNADRLRRFENEARSAGFLNHPNVLAIYDVGSHGGAPFLVSELLEGETLREKLQHGPLSFRKVIDFALQIARGLAAAHEKGIVHRDLKPENLFVTKDGRIKILDFGLAKLKPLLNRTDVDDSTQTLGTSPGVVMGTVGYMSPEQVRAEDVDNRSDIFAFGAILYEMLSAKRAFQGNSAAEVMNAILKEEPPDIAQSRRDLPLSLERIVRHSLEKSAATRFQSINDIAFCLDALSGVTDSTMSSRVSLSKQPKVYQHLGWIVAVALSLVIVAVFAFFQRAPTKVEAVRFSVLPPEKATNVLAPTISPDGRHLAFTAATEGNRLLWVRPLSSLSAYPLPGTEGASYPFWSPDSQFLGFFAQGKLKKIALSGGPATTLSDAPTGSGGTWSRDQVILSRRG